MTSKKRSARARQIAQFEAQLGNGLDGAFEREKRKQTELAACKESARRTRACKSKNRYATRDLARAAAENCAEHGVTGLSAYRCSYCNGWHLTSRNSPDTRDDVGGER